jgi:hypothetical protein
MYKTSVLLATGVVLLLTPGQQTRQIAPFHSIDIRDGGHVVIRPGPTHRVTFLKGSQAQTRVAVTDGGVLVIDRCSVGCPERNELELEIVAPNISRLSLANGGWIATAGAFDRQPEISVAVMHGGTIDVRSMAVDRVTATVENGGRILAVPRAALFASVTQGGVVLYWGNPQVKRSIEHGGIVQKGTAADIDLPLLDIGPAVIRAVDPASSAASHKRHRPRKD